MSHHPACPDGAHVHAYGPSLLAYSGWMVFLDTDTVVLCLEQSVAERVAHLINTHGLADIPDRIPDEVLWAAPHPDDRLIDFRLPPNPNEDSTP